MYARSAAAKGDASAPVQPHEPAEELADKPIHHCDRAQLAI
jgi:hypothetical protein